MFAVRAPAALHFAEPTGVRSNIQRPRALHFAEPTDGEAEYSPEALASFVSVAATHHSDPSLGTRSAEATGSALAAYRGAQDSYLAAGGTLTQFNAIMVAVAGAAMAGADGPLKLAIALALVLHVGAAFLLCWAARPVKSDRARSASMALMTTIEMTDDTFRNYRLGWRITMLAMLVSSVSVALYVWESLNAPGADLKRLSFTAW